MSINNLYALLGFAAAGAVGGGIYFIYPNSPKPITTLKERLKKEKYSVLSDDDNQNGQTVLSKYNSSEHKQNNRFVSGNGTTSLEDLKRVCSSTLAMEEGDSISYERVKLGCTVPRTVQERLKDLGIDVLKTSGDTEDKSKGVALESEYKETGNNDIKDFQVDSVTNDTSGQKLRNKCNEYIAKDKGSSEYDYYLDKASKGCSDKK